MLELNINELTNETIYVFGCFGSFKVTRATPPGLIKPWLVSQYHMTHSV